MLTSSPNGMPPWPVDADRVLEGRPGPRGSLLCGFDDGRTWGGLWQCDAGRFEVVFEADALVVLLSGCLVVQTNGGETLTLQEGDVASLPTGLDCVLTVPDSCRCAFVAASEPVAAAG